MCLSPGPEIPEECRHADWHHRVHVRGAAHDANVGEFGLRFAREVRSYPRTQYGSGFARVEYLEMGNDRVSGSFIF